MGWTKVSESRWERPVDGLEGYFIYMAALSGKMCEGREHYTIWSEVELETDIPDLESALRKAWVQLRYQQPQIATTSEGMKKVYEVPDEKALQEWLASTFIVSESSNTKELYQHVAPIKQATLYFLPKSMQLVFRGHHYMIDGIGAFTLLHEYLSVLPSPIEDIKFGDEPSRLNPTLPEAFGFPPEPTQALSQKAADLGESYLGSTPGIGPVSKVGLSPSRTCRNKEVVFPADWTDTLVKACKRKGITVTSAIHAAYIGAIVKHADRSSKLTEYVTMNQFNLRPYLPEPYNSSQHAASVWYSFFPYKIGLPSSYWDVARSLNNYYQNSFKDDAQLMEVAPHFTQAVYEVVQTPEFLANPVPRDALVSSLGIVEQLLQRDYGGGMIKVKDAKLGVDVVLGMSMLFLYTFQDRLRLVYCYNDGFENPQDIQTYLDEVKNILDEELLNGE